jgi:hypothetical protein
MGAADVTAAAAGDGVLAGWGGEASAAMPLFQKGGLESSRMEAAACGGETTDRGAGAEFEACSGVLGIRDDERACRGEIAGDVCEEER